MILIFVLTMFSSENISYRNSSKGDVLDQGLLLNQIRAAHGDDAPFVGYDKERNVRKDIAVNMDNLTLAGFLFQEQRF